MTIIRDLDGVIKTKIILVVIYCGLTILSIVLVDGSYSVLVNKLLLQVGEAISSLSPLQVTP